MADSDRWTSMSQLETWQLASLSLPLPQFLQGFRLCLYVSKTSRCTRQYKGCVVDCPVEPTSVQPLCSIAFLIVMASCNLNALKYVLLLFYFQKHWYTWGDLLYNFNPYLFFFLTKKLILKDTLYLLYSFGIKKSYQLKY